MAVGAISGYAIEPAGRWPETGRLRSQRRRERQHSPASASGARLRRREWRLSGAQRACAKSANARLSDGECAVFGMAVGCFGVLENARVM